VDGWCVVVRIAVRVTAHISVVWQSEIPEGAGATSWKKKVSSKASEFSSPMSIYIYRVVQVHQKCITGNKAEQHVNNIYLYIMCINFGFI